VWCARQNCDFFSSLPSAAEALPGPLAPAAAARTQSDDIDDGGAPCWYVVRRVRLRRYHLLRGVRPGQPASCCGHPHNMLRARCTTSVTATSTAGSRRPRRQLHGSFAARAATIATQAPVALGLDFGTESCRAVLVGVEGGGEIGSAVSPFTHGVITGQLPPPSGVLLGAKDVAQHAGDWLESAAAAVRKVMAATATSPSDVVGIGVDFTSCTLLPTTADGQPLFMAPPAATPGDWGERPHAWPKLWKHHGAISQAEELTAAASAQGCEWLQQYSGVVGCEWLLPKALQAFDEDAEAFSAAEVWLEGGDWFVWHLTGGGATGPPPRSSCMAGYKACWVPDSGVGVAAAGGELTAGLPSVEFLDSVRPGFGAALHARLPGGVLSPGERAGRLSAEGAALLGLEAGTAVAAGIIDAHSGVPGAGVGGAGTLVITMGTSGCYMLCAEPPQGGGAPSAVDGAFGQVVWRPLRPFWRPID
jgi:ribulokinase